MAGDGWPEGSGVFETLRTEDGRIFELGRHMRRATTSAKKFEINLPSEELIRKAIFELLQAEPQSLGRLRLLFSDQQFIATHHRYMDTVTPAKLKISDQGSNISAIAFKTFPYNHRLSLLQQAKSEGFDEIICINPDGEVTEGAVSNFIFRIDDQWVTTPLSAGVLPGVQRAIAVERCGVVVKSLQRSDLAKATSTLLTSSLKIALAAKSIDDREQEIGGAAELLISQIRAQTQSNSVG